MTLLKFHVAWRLIWTALLSQPICKSCSRCSNVLADGSNFIIQFVFGLSTLNSVNVFYLTLCLITQSFTSSVITYLSSLAPPIYTSSGALAASGSNFHFSNKENLLPGMLQKQELTMVNLVR